jgi:hypothetical protein
MHDTELALMGTVQKIGRDTNLSTDLLWICWLPIIFRHLG